MIFEFNWSWYEDYTPILFEGPEKTKKEFEADCKKAMAKSFDEYMEKEESWASLPNWIEIAAVKLEDYGYKIFKPIQFGYFGLYLPKSDRYCKENNEIRDKEYRERFPELLDEIKIMIQHNDILDAEMHKERYEKEN